MVEWLSSENASVRPLRRLQIVHEKETAGVENYTKYSGVTSLIKAPLEEKVTSSGNQTIGSGHILFTPGTCQHSMGCSVHIFTVQSSSSKK